MWYKTFDASLRRKVHQGQIGAGNFSDAVRQWWPLVEVLADEHNGATALAFHDVDASRKTLAVLRGQPGIRGAWLYAADGQILGDYIRNGDHPQPVLPDQTANAAWLEGNQLLLTCRVKLRGETVGWLTLRGDLRAEANQLRHSSLVVVICLLVAALAATAIAYRLQKTILNPVYGLARVADAVAARHDYSLRVAGENPDELGRLTTAFNEMLEQIERLMGAELPPRQILLSGRLLARGSSVTRQT